MCCTRKPEASKYYVGSWDSLIHVENMRPLTPGSGNGFPPCSHLGFVSLIMTPATKFESVVRSWEQTRMLPVSGFKIKSLRRTLRCDNLVNLNSVILIRYLGILQVGLYSYPHTQVAPIGSHYHLTKDIIGISWKLEDWLYHTLIYQEKILEVYHVIYLIMNAKMSKKKKSIKTPLYLGLPFEFSVYVWINLQYEWIRKNMAHFTN